MNGTGGPFEAEGNSDLILDGCDCDSEGGLEWPFGKVVELGLGQSTKRRLDYVWLIDDAVVVDLVVFLVMVVFLDALDVLNGFGVLSHSTVLQNTNSSH